MTAKEVNNYFENKLGDELESSEQEFNGFLLQKIKNVSEDIWNKTKAETDSNSDLYSGTVGIAFMFWHLSQHKSLLSDNERKECLTRARTLIIKGLDGKERQTDKSFLTGSCGHHLIASIIFHTLNELQERDRCLDLFVQLCPLYVDTDFKDPKRDTFSEGRAGFVCAALVANHWFGLDVIPIQTLQSIGISIIKSGMCEMRCPTLFICKSR